jgi:hypothetical protein
VRRQQLISGNLHRRNDKPMKYKICAYELLDHVLVTVTTFDLWGDEGTSRTRLYTFPSTEIHAHRLEELLAALAQKVEPQ